MELLHAISVDTRRENTRRKGFYHPQVSGRIVELNIKDNQLVNAGDLLLTIDKTPFQIAELNAQAQLAKAQSDLAKANNEANRRRHLSQNFISAEELDTANLNVKAMQPVLMPHRPR